MKFIKKFTDTQPSDSLIVMLHEHLTGFEPNRGVKRIHASELTKATEGFCPRFYALIDQMPTMLKDNWLSTSEVVTYKIGRDLQDGVVHWFADMGRCIGHWRCLGCNHVHEFQKRPKSCEHCKSKHFKPEEVRFQSLSCGASCGVDMLVSTSRPKLVPVEIKTIDKEKFKELKAPLAEHRLRTNLYLRLIEESEHEWAQHVDTQHARVLYVSKGGYGNADKKLKDMGLSDNFTPFKEYTVTRDDSQTDGLVIRSKAVMDFRNKVVGMPQGICSTALVPRAKKCSVCKPCFSGQYPATYEWSDAQSIGA